MSPVTCKLVTQEAPQKSSPCLQSPLLLAQSQAQQVPQHQAPILLLQAPGLDLHGQVSGRQAEEGQNSETLERAQGEKT